jgi:hypothetical protein
MHELIELLETELTIAIVICSLKYIMNLSISYIRKSNLQHRLYLIKIQLPIGVLVRSAKRQMLLGRYTLTACAIKGDRHRLLVPAVESIVMYII